MAEPATGERTSQEARRLPYLRPLDGLRGVAVVAVLLYHSGYRWARGGYLGVTAFFALSGFLITGLLLSERDRLGHIDLGAFWGRRARRLVPAILVFFGLVIAYVAVAHPHVTGIFGDALAAAAWVANWRFILAGRSYSSMFSQPSPFQHMWSLAIEEQFYLLLPLVAVVLLGRRGQARRGRLAAVLLAGVVASTVACAVFHPAGAGPLRSYYGTDARVAEPLVGALLAVVLVGAAGYRRLPRFSARAVDVAGVLAAGGLLLLMSVLGENDDRLYRGGFLLAAVLTAIVVAAVTQERSVVGRVLSTDVLVRIGRVSYGVYLFHWPIFLWLTPARTGLDPVALLAVRSLATFGLAALSYHLIEAPVRHGRVPARVGLATWASFAPALLGGVAIAASLGSVGSVPLFDSAATVLPPPPVTQAAPAAVPVHTAAVGSPTSTTVRPATTVVRRQTAVRTPATTASTQPKKAATPAQFFGGDTGAGSSSPPAASPAAGTPAQGGVAKAPGALRIAVVGDSMADGLGKALVNWANNRSDVVVYDLATPACPLSRGGVRRFPDGYLWDVPAGCGWWADPQSQGSQYLAQFAPDMVFFQDGMNETPDRKLPSWPNYRKPGDPFFDSWLLSEYRAAVQATTNGKATAVFANAVCANWSQIPAWDSMTDADQRVQALNTNYQLLTANGVKLLDLDSELCPNGKFTNTVEGVSNARPDGYHLSDDAAAAVVSRWLAPKLMSASPKTPTPTATAG